MGKLEDFLESRKAASVKDLSDKDLRALFTEGVMGIGSQVSYDTAMRAVKRGDLKEADVLSSMRKSATEKKPFLCTYIENESCDGTTFDESKVGWQLSPKP